MKAKRTVMFLLFGIFVSTLDLVLNSKLVLLILLVAFALSSIVWLWELKNGKQN